MSNLHSWSHADTKVCLCGRVAIWIDMMLRVCKMHQGAGSLYPVSLQDATPRSLSLPVVKQEYTVVLFV